MHPATDQQLNLAEIPFDTGGIRFRYSRYLALDGMRWIRHGLFRSYYKDGSLASQGAYEHGKEEGMWRDYHENGELAAEGSYREGSKVGVWNYWDETRTAEEPEING